MACVLALAVGASLLVAVTWALAAALVCAFGARNGTKLDDTTAVLAVLAAASGVSNAPAVT